jgi:fucose permease
MMTQTFTRDRLTWLTYLLLAFYGYFLNILGPITPFLKDELELSYTVSSLHFTAFASGILLVGSGGHLLIRHIGRRRSLWIGAFGMSLGALFLSLGRLPIITIGASFLMGLIGSLILVIVPVALFDRHAEMRTVALTEANVIASLAATIAPLTVGLSARWLGNWRPALGLIAITPILLYLGFERGISSKEPDAQKDPSQIKQPLPFLFWVYWMAIVMAVSAEFCMIFWSADYLENVFGMLRANAAQAVSLFLAAMILGRMAGSRLVRQHSTLRVIAFSIFVAGLGFLLFWKAGNVILGLSGLFITGLGIATLYPLILALGISTTKYTVQASARSTLASGAAILTLPFVLGRLADAVGIGLAYGVVPFLLLSVLLIILFAGKVSAAQSMVKA